VKIAFLHSEGKFNVEFLRELRAGLAQHELLTWIRGESAPAHDLDVLLSIGIVGRAELANQPKLALIQTVSTGYENVDINTASELGIWVSYHRRPSPEIPPPLPSLQSCFSSERRDISAKLFSPCMTIP
jgi:lactate dehydrogenase-like 2-hydroxyacid dehydrogenase